MLRDFPPAALDARCPRGYPPQVTFTLHPSFKNPVRVKEVPPYEVTESGWGEFDIGITARACRSGPPPL